MITDYLPILRESSFFRGVSDEDILALLECFHAVERTYSRGEMIMRMDEKTGDKACFVLEGNVDTIEEDFWGNETLRGRFVPGQVVGDAFMLTGRDMLPFHIVSHRRSAVLLLDFRLVLEPCKRDCERHYQLMRNLLPIFAEKVVYLLDLLRFTTKRTLRDKLLSYLSAQAAKAGSNRFTIDLDRQVVANYLVVDRSSLSAELGRMQREGLLLFKKNQFELLETDQT